MIDKPEKNRYTETMKTLLLLIATALTAFAQPKSYQVTEIRSNGFLIRGFTEEKVIKFDGRKDNSYLKTKFTGFPQYLSRDETNMSFPLNRKFYADLTVVKVYVDPRCKIKKDGSIYLDPKYKGAGIGFLKVNIVAGSNYRIYIPKDIKRVNKPLPDPRLDPFSDVNRNFGGGIKQSPRN